MTNPIVVGEIDRISKSGNGMLQTDSKEYNLGPINQSAVGNTAVAVSMGAWALCLTPYDDLEEYISRFRSTVGIDQTRFYSLLSDMNEKLDSASDILPDTALQNSTDYAVGDTIEVEIALSTSEGNYVIFDDWPVIEVVDAYLSTGEQTIVEIVEVGRLVSKAKISPKVTERAPQPGAELTVTIRGKNDSTGYAVHDGLPVVLLHCAGWEGDNVRVGVESIESNRVKATVASLPAESRPEIGDELTVIIREKTDSTGYAIHNDLPVVLPHCAGGEGDDIRVGVESIESNRVKATVASLPTESRPEAGDELTVTIREKTDSTGYAIHEGLPVVLPHCAGGEGDDIRVGVESIESNRVKATVASLPTESRPEVGDELTVTIREKTGSTGYAIYDDLPVVLPHCAAGEGDNVRVGVESIESNRVKATVASLPTESRPEVGDELTVRIREKTGSTGYVIYDDLPVVLPHCAAGEGDNVRVGVESIESNHVKATVASLPAENRPEVGDELTVTIREKTDSTGYALHDDLPVVLPHCAGREGDNIRVGVKSVRSNRVKATVASLPTESRQEVGNTLNLDVELPGGKSSHVLIHDGVPVKITQTTFSMDGVLPIEIFELRANGAIGRVNLAAYSDLSEGARLSLEGLTHHNDQLFGKQNGIPVVLPLSRPIPSVPDSVPVTVTEIQGDAAYASIRHRPEIRELQDGEAITVDIKGRIDEYLAAEYEDYPVWVSWASDEPDYPPTLTVEVTEITDYGLFASPPILSDMRVSRHGDVLPARVEAVHSGHTFVSIVKPVEDEAYVLPVKIPISFDVSGEIGIEIVGQEKSYLVGTIRALETGETATQVPVYLQKAQQALFSIREQNFEAAAESARVAAEATENGVRQAEALRVHIFASGGATLSNNRSHEQVLNEIDDVIQELDSLDLPDAYRSLVDTELDIYKKLLSAVADEAPDSVQGLQRVAYDVDTRGRLNGIASQIQREFVGTATDVDVNNWTPEFPHRLLMFRIAQVCTGLDSPPAKASKLTNQYPPIERIQWRIAPAASSEPSPGETVSVVPETIGRPSDADKSSDTVEALEDGLSGSESSEPADRSEDDQSPPEPSVTAKKVDDVSAEPPESQPRTEVDTDTSASAETTDGTREPIKDSGGTKPTSTDETESVERTEETQDTMSPNIESTIPTEPPATTSELRTLRNKAEAAASDDPTRDTSSTGGGSQYQRSPAIKEYAKARANGVCEACGDPAPFETPDGQPYLEAHHVDELGQGGKDHPDKVAAVCPTCHKRIHYGEDGDALNEALRERLEQGLADIGVE